jgi:hypothetical protein
MVCSSTYLSTCICVIVEAKDSLRMGVDIPGLAAVIVAVAIVTGLDLA